MSSDHLLEHSTPEEKLKLAGIDRALEQLNQLVDHGQQGIDSLKKEKETIFLGIRQRQQDITA